jgi:hypothetical protein
VEITNLEDEGLNLRTREVEKMVKCSVAWTYDMGKWMDMKVFQPTNPQTQ